MYYNSTLISSARRLYYATIRPNIHSEYITFEAFLLYLYMFPDIVVTCPYWLANRKNDAYLFIYTMLCKCIIVDNTSLVNHNMVIQYPNLIVSEYNYEAHGCC